MVNIFGYPCIPEKNPTKNHLLSNKKDHKSNIDSNTKGNDGMTLNFHRHTDVVKMDTVLGTKYKE